MFQDNKNGKIPGQQTPDAKKLAEQAAAAAAENAADAAGGKVKEVKDKAKQVQQAAGQAMAYAGMAQQAGAALFKTDVPDGAPGTTTGIAGDAGMHNAPAAGAGTSNAAAVAATEVLGVSHMTQLTIVVEGTQIRHYKYFSLSQSAVGHHNFSLVLDHDALGSPVDHQMEDAQKLLGKRITVTLAFRNIQGSPERDFIGVITQVGFNREFGNKGNVVLSGSSPTILMDAAPHIQSFGGKQAVSLKTIAETVFKEALGSKYQFRSEPAFSGNVSYSSQYDETHYNYLARMAEAYGEQFFYDGKTIHFGKLPEPEKAISLTFGKDVDEVDIKMKTRHVKRSFYGYNSSSNEKLTTGETRIKHQSALAKDAYDISEQTFITPSLGIAPLKASTSKDVEAAQKSTSGSVAVDVFTTSGRTSVPFLYPGCIIDMNMRKADSAESSYFTRLMVTEVNHSVDTLGNYSGYFEAIAADTGYLPAPGFHQPVAEPQIATVTDNKDTQGRIQVKFDWQMGDATSEWIRVMSPDAGGSEKVSKNRGFMAIPEIGDQVMVGFVHNHPDRPYVMGGLYHGKVGGGGGAGNNIKSLSSKSGHTVELNDGGGITVKDKTGGNHIVVDGNNKITVTSSQTVELTNGKASITLEGDKITIYADEIEIAKSGGDSSKIEMKGLKTLVSGKNEMTVKSSTKATVESDGTTDIKAKSALTADSMNTTVKSSAVTVVQGPTVNIN